MTSEQERIENARAAAAARSAQLAAANAANRQRAWNAGCRGAMKPTTVRPNEGVWEQPRGGSAG